MRQALDEYSITFLTLLNIAIKDDTYAKRWALSVSSYPHLEKEDQEAILKSLWLPDDLLTDILEEENTDDISELNNIL